MSDLIRREEDINIIHNKIQSTSDFLQHDALIDVEFEVDELPTVEAKEVVHGKWIPYTISKLFSHTCSVCHCDVEEKTPFCPNCGADMRTSAE